jgi:cytochrome c1
MTAGPRAATLGLAMLLAACEPEQIDPATAGRIALEAYDCGVCHRIPGVRGAHGVVGPPLGGLGKRIYIAGKLPNTDAMLARWIVDPPALAPGTAMPAVGVSEREAHAMAAYLQTLR